MQWEVIVFGGHWATWAICLYSVSCMSGTIFNPRSLLNSYSNILIMAHLYIEYCIWMYMICIANKQTISTVHATDTRVLISSSVQKKLQSAMGAFCLSPFCAWTLLRAIFIRLSSNAGIMPVTSQRPRRLALVRRGSLFSFTFYQHPGWSPKSYSHSGVWTQNEKFMLGKVSGALQNPTLRAEPLGGGQWSMRVSQFRAPTFRGKWGKGEDIPIGKSEATLANASSVFSHWPMVYLGIGAHDFKSWNSHEFPPYANRSSSHQLKPWDMAKRLEISQNENHLVPATQQQPVPSHSQRVKSI